VSSYDFGFYILLLGDASVDKASFTHRYCYNLNNPNERLTIGVDFHVKIVDLQGKKIKLQIWDVGGEERFRFLLPTYCLGKNGVIIFYDVTRSQTLEYIEQWITIIRQKNGKIPIILVGITEEKSEREVSREEGKEIANSRNLSGYLECNPKTGRNVEKVFEELTRLILADTNFTFPKRKRSPLKTASTLEYMREKSEVEKKKRGIEFGLSLDDLLIKLLRANPAIKFAVIVSAEGLPIASALPQGVYETRIAAMTATLLSLSKKAIVEMKKGNFDQLYIKGSEGYFLVMQINSDTILAVFISKNARFGKLTRYGKSDDDNGDDYLPYPYIFTPPKPPDDFEMAPHLQIRAPSKEKAFEDEYYCQYCGMKLTKEEQSTHSCIEKPEKKR
jgi:small GTP-binding protein